MKLESFFFFNILFKYGNLEQFCCRGFPLIPTVCNCVYHKSIGETHWEVILYKADLEAEDRVGGGVGVVPHRQEGGGGRGLVDVPLEAGGRQGSIEAAVQPQKVPRGG